MHVCWNESVAVCVCVCPDLFVQPSSDHHRDIGISFNGLLSLPKAVHLGPGALKHTQTSIEGFQCYKWCQQFHCIRMAQITFVQVTERWHFSYLSMSCHSMCYIVSLLISEPNICTVCGWKGWDQKWVSSPSVPRQTTHSYLQHHWTDFHPHRLHLFSQVPLCFCPSCYIITAIIWAQPIFHWTSFTVSAMVAMAFVRHWQSLSGQPIRCEVRKAGLWPAGHL